MSFNNEQDFGFISRLNADGSRDYTFNPRTGANDVVFSTAIQPDGKIILGGNFNLYNGVVANRITRMDSDGSLDETFNINGSGADGYVLTTTIQPDGKIIIGGDFTTYNDLSAYRIARLNVDGSLDETFQTDAGVDSYIFASAIQPDGKIIVGGAFSSMNGSSANKIGRFNADGSRDNTFEPGSGANNTINAGTTA